MRSIYNNLYQMMINDLIYARELRGMTQADVSKIWGRNQSILAKIEIYERRIDFIEFITLGEIVGLDIHHVIEKMRYLIRIERNENKNPK